ncbi:hypothetical protein [Micromonospora echinofusca]|uniref:hypothetical protein n=1 Tax=Micromonospora echinofusca TaxID=47858 RepID=UPI00371A8162
MGESLLNKARRLHQLAGEVKAVRSALDNARRLQNRAAELRKALDEPALSTRTWHACAAAGVDDLVRPDHTGLAQAVANLRRGLEAGEPPSDLGTSFNTVKHALAAVARQTDSSIADAWPRFANAKAEEVGIRSVRMLPPSVQQRLASAILEMEQSRRAAPRNPSQVKMFLRQVAWLREEISEVGGADVPAQLEPVFNALNREGFPLRKLTAEQFRLLQEHDLADGLVVRWQT